MPCTRDASQARDKGATPRAQNLRGSGLASRFVRDENFVSIGFDSRPEIEYRGQ
jgi:hypothetical protein